MGKKKNRNGGEKRTDYQQNDNNNQQKEENTNHQNEEQNNNKQIEEKKNDGGGGGGGKKEDPPLLSVVLKMEVHCEGCATKIRKAVRGFKGVDSVRPDLNSNKVTVVGKVDPAKLREFLEQKMKKKVEQLSPAPKDKENKDGNGCGEKKKPEEKTEKKTEEKKKPKEQPVTTAVMKLNLHCQGCIQKIRSTVMKTKGFHDLSIDEQKNQLTVKGAIDMKALAATLKEKMKKPVEIVPPKKDEKKENGGDGGGDCNKEKGGEGNGGEEKKQKGGGQGGKGGCNGGGESDEFRVVYMQYGYQNQCVNGYGFGYPLENYHEPAPQIFSDENPNACSIM